MMKYEEMEGDDGLALGFGKFTSSIQEITQGVPKVSGYDILSRGL